MTTPQSDEDTCTNVPKLTLDPSWSMWGQLESPKLVLIYIIKLTLVTLNQPSWSDCEASLGVSQAYLIVRSTCETPKLAHIGPAWESSESSS